MENYIRFERSNGEKQSKKQRNKKHINSVTAVTRATNILQTLIPIDCCVIRSNRNTHGVDLEKLFNASSLVGWYIAHKTRKVLLEKDVS